MDNNDEIKGSNVNDTLITMMLFIYLLTLIGGTAYLVEAYKWSPWWFALTFFFGQLRIKTGVLDDVKET